MPNFIKDDVELAVYVNGVLTDTIPAKGSYIVSIECDSGNGEWDYDNWSISIANFRNGTKCKVSFTSSSNTNLFKGTGKVIVIQGELKTANTILPVVYATNSPNDFSISNNIITFKRAGTYKIISSGGFSIGGSTARINYVYNGVTTTIYNQYVVKNYFGEINVAAGDTLYVTTGTLSVTARATFIIVQ